MNIFLSVLIGLFGTSFVRAAEPAATPPKEITARSVMSEIDFKGAAEIIKLYARPENDKRWMEILKKIEMGNPEWLDVAAKLRPAADGYLAEGLVSAIHDVFPKEPERILERIGKGFTIEEVCGEGAVEEETKRATIAALKKIRNALLATEMPSVQKQKEDCLVQLDHQIKETAKWKNEK